MPFCARNSAVLVPMIPPPTITTSARSGSASSDRTGSTRGAIASPYVMDRGRPARSGPEARGPNFMLIDRRVHKVGDAVEAQRVPGVGSHVVRDVGERHAARRVGPRIRGAGATVPEGLRRADRAKAADAVAVAAHMRPQAAMHRNAAHRVVA